MSIAPTRTGSRLLLPLLRLDPPAADPATAPSPSRTLDLDAQLRGALATWLPAVRAAAEACLLLDEQARVCAASPGASVLFGAPVTEVLGARLVDVVAVADLTGSGTPVSERSLPPLRALATGGLARGLVRVRTAQDELLTFDVVAVPLADHDGVLSFFLAV